MNFNKVLKFIRKEFLYGGHLQCFTSVAIGLTASILLRVKTTPLIFIVIYLLSYVVYACNRYLEISEDKEDNAERTLHLMTYQNKIPLLMGMAIVLSIIVLIYLNSKSLYIYSALLLIFGIFYTRLFKPLTKKIYLFKNFTVAGAFAMIVLLISPTEVIFKSGFILVLIFVFLKSIAMQIFLDIKDARGDKFRGLKTLAAIKGEKRTADILRWAFPVATIPLFAGLSIGILPPFTIFLFLSLLFDYYSLSLIKDGSPVGYLIQGGHAIVWPILLIIGNYLM